MLIITSIFLKEWKYGDGIDTCDGTYFSSRIGTFSAIDLSLCSPTLALRLSRRGVPECTLSCALSDWRPGEESHVSRRWCRERANWTSFAKELSTLVVTWIRTYVITEVAESHIPWVGSSLRLTPVLSDNAEVKQAVREKRRYFNRLKLVPNLDNLIAYKRLRYGARRNILPAKIFSWEKLVSGITRSIPVEESRCDCEQLVVHRVQAFGHP